MAKQSTEGVFSADEVANLFTYQLAGEMHPFTCGNRGDGKHREIGSDLGMLIPTINGWICPFCDYRQSWAHAFMTAKSGGEPSVQNKDNASDRDGDADRS